MQLFIKTFLDNKTIVLHNIDSTITVYQLKQIINQKIQNIINCEVPDYFLYYHCVYLKETQTLQKSDIINESTIYLRLKFFH
jgi:hypothetical protein